MLRTFSTATEPGGRRLDYWNELIGGIFPGMTVSADPALEASWSACRLGDVSVAVARSPKAVVRRWQDAQPMVASNRALIHLQHGGFSTTAQLGAAATLVAGDMTLCAADEPYEIHISERNEMFVVDCPLAALESVDGRFARVIDGRAPAVGLLHDFLASVFRQHWPDPVDPHETDALGGMIAGLVRRCLTGPVETRPEATDDRRRVTDFVEAHLDEGALRTGLIAQRLSLAPRTVQTIFAEMATTPTAYILNRRLAIAATRLRDGTRTGGLADLAYELGFSDSAHFARRFKLRFGVSPSTFARRCRNA
ncbi:MAG TPA: helix-turn-helix domain-containing protein [Caulobacteraceae bacterium]